MSYPEVGKFDTQVDARIKCQMSTTKYNADLAFLGTPRINELAADIVSDMSVSIFWSERSETDICF